MYYSIQHMTRFRYSAPISESIMEVRIQPRSEGNQRCLNFDLHTNPRSFILSYRGENGNKVHHFDVPNRHMQLTITAEALVELAPTPAIPEKLDRDAWDELDAMTATDEYWDMLEPSTFAKPSKLLHELAQEIRLQRHENPLTTLRMLNRDLHDSFEYATEHTKVDSPIDDALRARRGVCQDFSHIMIALVRELRIPCRYVSGYLFHRVDTDDLVGSDATHAWVEALLPGMGWVGFDPTNNLIVSDRHIRVAIGRDYADVPPTRGVFKGNAMTDLTVAVQVLESEGPPISDTQPLVVNWPEAQQSDEEQQQQQ